MKSNKYGAGHLEAILAFILFIGFLVFAFIFFSPFESGRTLDSSIDYAFREVIEYTEAKIEFYSVVISPDVEGPVGIPLRMPSNYYGARVENSMGKITESNSENLGVVYFDNSGNGFFKLIFAPGLDDGTLEDGRPLTSDEYSVSSSDIRNVLRISNFSALKTEYEENYADLKEKFNLPNRIDFDFSLILRNGSIIEGKRQIPEDLEILSKIDRIEVVGNDGVTEFADLIVRVW